MSDVYPKLPSSAADGAEILDIYGNIWIFSTKTNSWTVKGVTVSAPNVGEGQDGLVTPDVHSRLETLREIAAEHDFGLFKIYPAIDDYWYYFVSHNKTVNFTIESEEKLRVEANLGRLLALLSRHRCYGTKGQKGKRGIAGIKGIAGPPERTHAATINQSQLLVSATVVTDIDTPISLRMYLGGVLQAEIWVHLDGNLELRGAPFVQIDLAQSDLTYDGTRLTGYVTGGWTDGAWTYKACQVGRTGADGEPGRPFFDIQESLVTDPTLRSNTAVISLRSDYLGNLMMLTAPMPTENIVNKLSFPNPQCRELGAPELSVLSLTPTLSNQKLFSHYKFGKIDQDTGNSNLVDRLRPNMLDRPALELPDWTPVSTCFQQRHFSISKFDWQKLTNVPASQIAWPEPNQHESRSPVYPFGIQNPNAPGERCCQEDFFFCSNINDKLYPIKDPGDGIPELIAPPVPPLCCECDCPIELELQNGYDFVDYNVDSNGLTTTCGITNSADEQTATCVLDGTVHLYRQRIVISQQVGDTTVAVNFRVGFDPLCDGARRASTSGAGGIPSFSLECPEPLSPSECAFEWTAEVVNISGGATVADGVIFQQARAGEVVRFSFTSSGGVVDMVIKVNTTSKSCCLGYRVSSNTNSNPLPGTSAAPGFSVQPPVFQLSPSPSTSMSLSPSLSLSPSASQSPSLSVSPSYYTSPIIPYSPSVSVSPPLVTSQSFQGRLLVYLICCGSKNYDTYEQVWDDDYCRNVRLIEYLSSNTANDINVVVRRVPGLKNDLPLVREDKLPPMNSDGTLWEIADIAVDVNLPYPYVEASTIQADLEAAITQYDPEFVYVLAICNYDENNSPLQPLSTSSPRTYRNVMFNDEIPNQIPITRQSSVEIPITNLRALYPNLIFRYFNQSWQNILAFNYSDDIDIIGSDGIIRPGLSHERLSYSGSISYNPTQWMRLAEGMIRIFYNESQRSTNPCTPINLPSPSPSPTAPLYSPYWGRVFIYLMTQSGGDYLDGIKYDAGTVNDYVWNWDKACWHETLAEAEATGTDNNVRVHVANLPRAIRENHSTCPYTTAQGAVVASNGACALTLHHWGVPYTSTLMGPYPYTVPLDSYGSFTFSNIVPDGYAGIPTFGPIIGQVNIVNDIVAAIGSYDPTLIMIVYLPNQNYSMRVNGTVLSTSNAAILNYIANMFRNAGLNIQIGITNGYNSTSGINQNTYLNIQSLYPNALVIKQSMQGGTSTNAIFAHIPSGLEVDSSATNGMPPDYVDGSFTNFGLKTRQLPASTESYHMASRWIQAVRGMVRRIYSLGASDCDG